MNLLRALVPILPGLFVVLGPPPAAAQGTSANGNQMVNEGTSAPAVAYSLIEGGLPTAAVDGGGNVSGPPLFVDAVGSDGVAGTLDDDLRLQAGSPAIDAGDGGALPPDLAIDVTGAPRLLDGGSGMPVVDLGAYEYDAAAVAIETPNARTDGVVLSAAYPNPFNPQTTLHFSVQQAAPVRVTLYDVLGRTLRTLYDGTPAPGRPYTLQIDGSDLPAGLYVVRLSGERLHATRTILLIR